MSDTVRAPRGSFGLLTCQGPLSAVLRRKSSRHRCFAKKSTRSYCWCTSVPKNVSLPSYEAEKVNEWHKTSFFAKLSKPVSALHTWEYEQKHFSVAMQPLDLQNFMLAVLQLLKLPRLYSYWNGRKKTLPGVCERMEKKTRSWSLWAHI